jgi:hypothetical protein
VKRHARYEYKNIELRKLSFKTWPLNVPTIVQLAEAGLIQKFFDESKSIDRFELQIKVTCNYMYFLFRPLFSYIYFYFKIWGTNESN